VPKCQKLEKVTPLGLKGLTPQAVDDDDMQIADIEHVIKN